MQIFLNLWSKMYLFGLWSQSKERNKTAVSTQEQWLLLILLHLQKIKLFLNHFYYPLFMLVCFPQKPLDNGREILKDMLCVISICKYYDSVFKHSIYSHIRGGSWLLSFGSTSYSHSHVFGEDKYTLPASLPGPQFPDFQQNGYFFAVDFFQREWLRDRGGFLWGGVILRHFVYLCSFCCSSTASWNMELACS